MKATVIGLTGQTGAGKSTASMVMKKMGCSIIDADKVSREVMKPGTKCMKMLTNAFGCDIIKDNGSLDRALLAQRAFSSKENTRLLNSITHPFIIEKVKDYIKLFETGGAEFIVFDAPQLFESCGDKLCDVIVSVTAPKAVRLKRIMARDNLSQEEAQQRMNAQYSEEFFRENSDFVLDGSCGLENLDACVSDILENIVKGRSN